MKNWHHNNELFYFIDYGYEEIYNKEKYQVKALADQFYDLPRFVFGTSLLDHSNGNANVQKMVEYEVGDHSLDAIFEEYFNPNLDEHELHIHSILANTKDENRCYIQGEVYYGVEMYNVHMACLNQMIAIAGEEQVKITCLFM